MISRRPAEKYVKNRKDHSLEWSNPSKRGRSSASRRISKKEKRKKLFYKEDFVPSLWFIILMEVCERFVFNLLSN